MTEIMLYLGKVLSYSATAESRIMLSRLALFYMSYQSGSHSPVTANIDAQLLFIYRASHNADAS